MHDHVLQRIDITPRVGNRSQGHATFANRTVPVALGRSGTSVRKREGDGATPVGTWHPRAVWVRPDRTRLRAANLPLHRITADDGWCDAAHDRNYNHHVTLPYRASHEIMRRDDHLYDLVVVLDHNERGHRHLGSAVFMHLARPGHTPTEGCIAFAREHMMLLLAHLAPHTRIVVHR